MSINQSVATSGIDLSNSTNGPLGANGVAAGAWVDVSNYSNLTVIVYTDQPSATNGLMIQYSTDGTNIDDNDSYSIVANNGQQFSLPLAARYYRVSYTNGTVTQTIFRLQAKLHADRPKPSSVRISESISSEQDSELVKAVIMGQTTGTTGFDNMILTGAKELRIAQVSNTGGTQGALTIGTTAVLVAVSGTNLTNRISATLYNNSLVLMYWGYTNAVTTTTGTPIQPNQLVAWDVGPSTNIYVIAATVSNNARITEAAG